MAPFASFDLDYHDVIYSSTSTRKRFFHLIVYPSITINTTFPFRMFHLYRNLELLVADDRVDVSKITPYLPDSVMIHRMTFPDTSSEFIESVYVKENKIIHVGKSEYPQCQNLKMGESVTLDVNDDDDYQKLTFRPVGVIWDYHL